MKKIGFWVLLITFLSFACNSHQPTRKCNGKKGIKTPMGLM
ncbi:MAG TPA: hypothetical protein PK995_05390 [Bacteroidia bacterium]|nr:hypothetical protein [Bacteroidia bacterium]